MTDIYEDSESEKAILSGRAYDILKAVVTIWLPGIATLYFTLAGIWGLPAAEQVVGTLTALALFLGLGLRVSTNRYENSAAAYDGQVNVLVNEEGKKVFELDVGTNLDRIESMGSLKFKVN